MCVTVSASVALCLLFGPKLYLVLFHPEKCARNYPGNKKPTNNKTVANNSFKEGSQKNILKVGEKYFFLFDMWVAKSVLTFNVKNFFPLFSGQWEKFRGTPILGIPTPKLRGTPNPKVEEPKH